MFTESTVEKHPHLKPQTLATTTTTDLNPGVVESAVEWVPLLDYSVQTGVSLSTLRRYIKAGRIEFRLEDGRYLLPVHGMVNNQGGGKDTSPVDGHSKEGRAEIARLEMELRKAREENAELRMLVALYEESLSSGPSRGGNA